MSKKNGRRHTKALQAALDQLIELTWRRSAAAMGEQLMEPALKMDPELKTLVARLAKERVPQALGRLKVKPSSEGA